MRCECVHQHPSAKRKLVKTHVVLLLVDLGALERLGAERVADLERLRVLREALEELVVDALLHEDTRTRTTALAVVVAVCTRQRQLMQTSARRKTY